MPFDEVDPFGEVRRHAHPVILILSDDAVAAALLGALVETLGYTVRFAHPPEDSEQSIRRVRPKVRPRAS